MATIKSFTDLSQSKTLAEVLPLESADMNFHKIQIAKSLYGEPIYKYEIDLRSYNQIIDWTKDTIPCWSLAALLGVLPKIDNYRLEIRHIDKGYCCCYTEENNGGDLYWYYADNPVDAAYSMVVWLLETKRI